MMLNPSSRQMALLGQCLVILFLSHFPGQTRAQSYQNMSLGTTLTPSGTTTSWPSPSGDFAFGFIPNPSSSNTTTLFLLAIWFAKIPGNTIVWTANGNSPAPEGSKLNLTLNGQLVLTDPNGDTIFQSSSGGSHAAMLDTGNLVLVDASSGDTIWQSFDNPTDTILPTQILSSTSSLRSHLAATNYSKGRFMLYQDSGGKLSLSEVAIPTGGLYKAYWSTDQADVGTQLVFDTAGTVYFDLNNKTHDNITSANLSSSSSLSDFHQKATLDIDGVFRHYIYPKNSNSGWEEKWTIRSYVPTDGCMRSFIDSCCGSGVCGYNSFCQMDAENEFTTCKCPYNYSLSVDAYKGCSPDFAPQRCDADDTARFQLTVMRGVNWPGSDYEHYDGVTEEQCRENCLQDCYCAVAIFGDNGCWKKRLPLSNGRSGEGWNTMALIKVPKDGATIPEQPAEQIDNHKKGCSKALIVAGSSLLGGSVLLNLLLLASTLMAALYYSGRRKEKQARTYLDAGGFNLQSFTNKELLEATNGFSEELGRGAFGVVFKGVLRRETTIISIAVKKLDKLSKDAEKEFMAEVRSIGQTHHKNLVRLIGFCNEGENRQLVYELMSNGSLASFIFGGSEEKPEWNKRVKIIFGVARGLLYLHEECASPIIHCDIKSQNILLDDNLVARISDFGLAKLLRADQTRTSTGIRGTKGYVAPEWFKSMPVTTKVDVYSFGVLLLEIICCRKNFKLELGNDQEEEEEEPILVYWAYDCYRDGRLDLLVESDREAMFDMRRLERFVMVAIWCIQEDPSLRPPMQKVTQMLEGSVAVPVPPDPSSFMSSIQ